MRGQAGAGPGVLQTQWEARLASPSTNVRPSCSYQNAMRNSPSSKDQYEQCMPFLCHHWVKRRGVCPPLSSLVHSHACLTASFVLMIYQCCFEKGTGG